MEWIVRGGGGSAGGADQLIDPMEHMAKHHHWVSNKCAAIVKMNQSSKGDLFWKLLLKLLEKNSLNEFTHTIIQQLQRIVWKHYGGTS
jgi:hypothetical protein